MVIKKVQKGSCFRVLAVPGSKNKDIQVWLLIEVVNQWILKNQSKPLDAEPCPYDTATTDQIICSNKKQ